MIVDPRSRVSLLARRNGLRSGRCFGIDRHIAPRPGFVDTVIELMRRRDRRDRTPRAFAVAVQRLSLVVLQQHLSIHSARERDDHHEKRESFHPSPEIRDQAFTS